MFFQRSAARLSTSSPWKRPKWWMDPFTSEIDRASRTRPLSGCPLLAGKHSLSCQILAQLSIVVSIVLITTCQIFGVYVPLYFRVWLFHCERDPPLQTSRHEQHRFLRYILYRLYRLQSASAATTEQPYGSHTQHMYIHIYIYIYESAYIHVYIISYIYIHIKQTIEIFKSHHRLFFCSEDLDMLHDVELLGRCLLEAIEPKLGEFGLDWDKVQPSDEP